MNKPPPAANPWVEEIAAYLRMHPQACDTARGAARWWLDAPVAEWPRVRQALDTMVSDGRLTRTTGADGTERYRLPAAAGGAAS